MEPQKIGTTKVTKNTKAQIAEVTDDGSANH